ncbi:MAG TPA: UDP-N-acetylglucosamine 1-carboxyvinyltransferase [Planctomycetota bacterium]|nr:UDP-N-acetylglucosamine 1-carboxyvinyltransferase [Planctomycetota bacterium]
MERMIIEGGTPLSGEVEISGSKNGALPLLAATLMADGPCTLRNVPNLTDIDSLKEILLNLGVQALSNGNTLHTQVVNEEPTETDHDLVRKLRASVCLLGPLLAKRGHAEIAFPGGCAFGDRPIDLHLKGLAKLGAIFKVTNGMIRAKAKKLKGAHIYLGGRWGSTVLGTANVLSAAVLAEGTTVIEHAACEPELEDLVMFLNAMGAKISGGGSHRLVVEGVTTLKGAEHTVLPDRIEAGTFMAAVGLAGGSIFLRGARGRHLDAVIDIYQEAGVKFAEDAAGLRVSANHRLKPVELTALPYPGFPTDLQPQTIAMLAKASGCSIVTERIYIDRFHSASELNRMGGRIRIPTQGTAVIEGVRSLSGAPVVAKDLRAAAALIIAGLAAKGQTELVGLEHLDRGYEKPVEKFLALGANIRRVSDAPVQATPITQPAIPSQKVIGKLTA